VESRIHSSPLFAHPAKATRTSLPLELPSVASEALPSSLGLPFGLYVPALFFCSLI